MNNNDEISTIAISKVSKDIKSEGIIYEGSIPTACLLGNINLDKDYAKAIEIGKEIIKEYPNDYLAHCNLMDSYFKMGDIENCNKEARIAIIKGHHTGYCENRLSVNLYKAKKYHQVIQLSEIEENPRSGLFFNDLHKRRLRAQKYLNKALDTNDDKLFSTEEIEELYQNIEKQRALRKWYLQTREYLNTKFKEHIKKAMFDENEMQLARYYLDEFSKLCSKYNYLI